jgi:rhodanese-related sulfurtransferase
MEIILRSEHSDWQRQCVVKNKLKMLIYYIKARFCVHFSVVFTAFITFCRGLIFLIGCYFSLFSTALSAAESQYLNISDSFATSLITQSNVPSDLVILDVRTLQEIDQGYIEGAQQLDFYNPAFTQNIARLDREKTYLVYCRSGARSAKTLTLMKMLKFKKVYNLQGGLLQWDQNQRPLVVN